MYSKSGTSSMVLTEYGYTQFRVMAVAASGAVAYSSIVGVAIDTLPTLVFDPPLPSRLRVRGVLPVNFHLEDLEDDNIEFTLLDNGAPLVSGQISRKASVTFDWRPEEGVHAITIQLSDGILTTAVLTGPTVTVIPYRNINET